MELLKQHGGPLKRCLVLVCAGALSGCATVVDIAERHGDANLVQERVVNQQLLLNVVRASHRQPLHFSRIPYIKLPLLSSAPWELTIPFGVVGAYSRNTAKSSVGGALITVEVAPQDGQEFIQGITTPVRLTLMDFYLQQGWPKQLVLYLFVEEMRLRESIVECKPLTPGGIAAQECAESDLVVSPEVVVRRYRNNPGNPTQLQDFAKAVDRITQCDLTVESDPPKRGPRLAEPWTAPVAGLPEAISASLFGFDGQGLALQIAGSSRLKLKQPIKGSTPACELPGDQSEAGSSSAKLRLQDDPLTNLSSTMKSRGAKARVPSGMAGGAPDLKDLSPGAAGTAGPGDKLVKGQKSYAAELVMRSPDSMVYYLGEVLRGPGEVRVARNDDSKSRATLFTARISDAGSDSNLGDVAAWVDYWGKRYSVPRPTADASGGPTDRSMQVLGLVGQILQLQNKGAAPPRATTVRVEP